MIHMNSSSIKWLLLDLGCGEPPKMNNAQRFGTVNDITYRCDEGYTGGGSAICKNRQWMHKGSCNSKCHKEHPE